MKKLLLTILITSLIFLILILFMWSPISVVFLLTLGIIIGATYSVACDILD
jgi:hypothetical protein